MDDLIGALVWLGGMNALPDDYGFWKTLLWPYQLGKYLALKSRARNP